MRHLLASFLPSRMFDPTSSSGRPQPLSAICHPTPPSFLPDHPMDEEPHCAPCAPEPCALSRLPSASADALTCQRHRLRPLLWSLFDSMEKISNQRVNRCHQSARDDRSMEPRDSRRQANRYPVRSCGTTRAPVVLSHIRTLLPPSQNARHRS
jgi:hypothetical protein